MSTATIMYDLYIQAEKDVLEGKTIQMDGSTMTLEDIDKIRAGRREWEIRVGMETATAAGQTTLYSLSDFS